MKTENPFDKHLAVNKGMPEDLRAAAVFVTDTLDVAWMSARAVFESKASPEVALAIYDRFVAQMQASLQSAPQLHTSKSVAKGRRTTRTP